MIVGDQNSFALESEISCAYERASLMALGFFNIHLGSQAYGVRAPDATLLACSFDAVVERVRLRGRHVAPFSAESDAASVADAIGAAIYSPEAELKSFWGLSCAQFVSAVYANQLIWAPDGDEAFDDGSFVVHLDVGNRVRLIGFKLGGAGRHHPLTLTDLWLEADRFYDVLDRWRIEFAAEWEAAPKVPA
jgi:Immunity protein 42